ncbi:MAG: SLC13 family permease [Caldilineaceae bacterium]|nr:SLC13 family permease [Caldilineaceae bacterium]
MSASQIFVLIVLVVPLTLVFMGRLREDIAALVMAGSLGLAQYFGLGVLGPAHNPDDATKALTGFGTPEVITLLSLFILTFCLDKYGVTRGIAKNLLKIGGKSERRLITLFATTAALLSLFMNTLAAGALLLPSALEASRRTGVKPSKLLIPIAYGTMLGGAATYLTTANIIVSSLLPLANPPQKSLGFFAFTPVGGVICIAGLAFLAIAGKYLLPNHEPPAGKVARTSDELSEVYKVNERMWEINALPNSSLVGMSLSEMGLGEKLGLSILGIRRGRRVIPIFGATCKIQDDDVLLVVGNEERAAQLRQEGYPVHPATQANTLDEHGTVVADLLVPPRSNVEGKTLRELAFRAKYGFTAVALWRDNLSHRTDVGNMKLRPGDSLLVIGPQDRFSSLKQQNNFVIAESTGDSGGFDQSKVILTLAIGVVALVSMFLGMPVELAMLSAAAVILVTGLLTPDEAYGAIKWRAIFLIAGTISVSVAMVQTGLAQMVGDAVVGVAAPFGAIGLVAGAYLLSAALTQVMGGQISPLVVGPITISAALQLGVNPQAIAVVTAIAGSVSFITPLSHPVNILMIAPANYTFTDFVKSGWLLTVICFIALMIAVPLFWQL